MANHARSARARTHARRKEHPSDQFRAPTLRLHHKQHRSTMSGSVFCGGPVTRGQKRRALEALEVLEERARSTSAAEANKPMLPSSTCRIWHTCRKSASRLNLHPSLLQEGDKISKVSKDETGLTRVVGEHICGGDSCFCAKRFKGQCKRLLQFVSGDGGSHESKCWAEDDPAISVVPVAKPKVPTARASTRSSRAQAKKFMQLQGNDDHLI